ncbi:MAG: hypothetical protein KDG50_06860 [Chromatiales bacterium]|nr:hypothetical protein [Chromatiales bacterium]
MRTGRRRIPDGLFRASALSGKQRRVARCQLRAAGAFLALVIASGSAAAECGAGYECARFEISADGEWFGVELRANLANTRPSATLVWISGHSGRDRFSAYQAELPALLERLAARGVRSIELTFTNAPAADGWGGYWPHNRRGHRALAKVLSAALDAPAVKPWIEGRRVLVATSNAATAAAYGLASEDWERRFDAMALIAGPFGIDLGAACRYPPWNGARLTTWMDQWQGWRGTESCAGGSPPATAPTRSLFTPDADRRYPQLRIAVVLGSHDELDPWLGTDARVWLAGVEARTRRLRVVDAPHVVASTAEGRRAIEAAISELVGR